MFGFANEASAVQLTEMALARVNRLWLDKVVDKSKQVQW